MAYNTGNPVPSRDPRDLNDNAENLDIRANSTSQREILDRLGSLRKTWYGMEQDFAEFLAGSGFELPPIPYVDAQPLTVQRPSQLIERAGHLYSVSVPSSFPAGLSGSWAADEPRLVVRSDQALRSALASDGGSNLVRHQGFTVGNFIDQAMLESAQQQQAIDDIEAREQARDAYQQLSISGGGVAIDASAAGHFGIDVSAAITSLSITGHEPGQAVSVDVAFTQGPSVGLPVSTPANVLLPRGTEEMVSRNAAETTVARLTNPGDGSPNWYYERVGVYPTDVSGMLPALLSENAVFNDEGESAVGWSNVGATLDVVSGTYLRVTRSASGVPSYMSRPIAATPSGTDFILYGKARAKYTANSAGVIWLQAGAQEVSIWFGSADASIAITQGAISIRGTTTAGVSQVAQVASGWDYEQYAVDFALHYDAKWGTLTCWFREWDGRWKFRGRVQCDWIGASSIEVLTTISSAAGSWIEFDHLTLARPNIALLSDSIGAGDTLFSPNPAIGWTNDESTWMRHAALYPGLRNNLVVNKGVGGNTSAQMLARVADVTSTGAQLVFFHASTNDYPQAVGLPTKASQTQSIIDAIATAGGQTVLLNAVYGTRALADNPGRRDYGRVWWEEYMTTLYGVACAIDIMSPMSDVNQYMDPALCQADGVHPNVLGYTAIGRYIARFQ